MPWKYHHNNSFLKNIILHLWIQPKKKKKLPAKSSKGFQTADTPTGGSNCISAVPACFPSDHQKNNLPSSSKLSATFCQAKQKPQKQNSRCKSGCNTYFHWPFWSELHLTVITPAHYKDWKVSTSWSKNCQFLKAYGNEIKGLIRHFITRWSCGSSRVKSTLGKFGGFFLS